MTSYESDWQKLNIDDGSEVLVWFWSLHLSAACHPETTRVVTPGLVPEQVQSEGELPVRLPEHLNDPVVWPVTWWLIHFVGQQTGNVLMRRNTPECFNRGPWQNQVFGPRPQDVCSMFEKQDIQNLNQKFYVLKTERRKQHWLSVGVTDEVTFLFWWDERSSASNTASRFNVTSLSLLVLVLIGQHRSTTATLIVV